MLITLGNIQTVQGRYSVIKKQRLVGSNTYVHYRLVEPLNFILSDGSVICVPEGFVWDGSSSPRLFWSLLPTEGDFEVAALIHDFLYNKPELGFSRSYVDQEMLLWSKSLSNTNKISLRNLDNYIRYLSVRIFGNFYWNRIRKLNIF